MSERGLGRGQRRVPIRHRHGSRRVTSRRGARGDELGFIAGRGIVLIRPILRVRCSRAHCNRLAVPRPAIGAPHAGARRARDGDGLHLTPCAKRVSLYRRARQQDANEADTVTQYNRDRHHRHSIRLPDYDYSRAGAYFVTLCTQDRECALEHRVLRQIIVDVWNALPSWFPTLTLDAIVVMPNHVHFIVWLGLVPDGVEIQTTIVGAPLAGARCARDGERLRATASVAPTEDPRSDSLDVAAPGWAVPVPRVINQHPTLADVVGTFKSLTFRAYQGWAARNDPEVKTSFWQRNYHERIVRNERELRALRGYIRANPRNWPQDTENPTHGQ